MFDRVLPGVWKCASLNAGARTVFWFSLCIFVVFMVSCSSSCVFCHSCPHRRMCLLYPAHPTRPSPPPQPLPLPVYPEHPVQAECKRWLLQPPRDQHLHCSAHLSSPLPRQLLLLQWCALPVPLGSVWQRHWLVLSRLQWTVRGRVLLHRRVHQPHVRPVREQQCVLSRWSVRAHDCIPGHGHRRGHVQHAHHCDPVCPQQLLRGRGHLPVSRRAVRVCCRVEHSAVYVACCTSVGVAVLRRGRGVSGCVASACVWVVGRDTRYWWWLICIPGHVGSGDGGKGVVWFGCGN